MTNPGKVQSEEHRQTEWSELWVAADGDISDDLAATLMYHEAWGVETLSPHTNPHFLPRLEDEPSRVLPPETLAEGWEWLVVTFPPEYQEDDARNLVTEVASDYGDTPQRWFLSRFEKRQDTDWLHRWKRYFKPLKVSASTWVCPSWETLDDKENDTVIVLDPGLSFGTGQHPTTRLCLSVLEDKVPHWNPKQALDVGCGSGILSIALALWGVPRIVGLDVDPASPEALQSNVALNKVQDRVAFESYELSEHQTPNDLVVANIIAPILHELAHDLVRTTSNGGHLLLSGILDEQLDELIEHFGGAFAQASRVVSEPAIIRSEDSPWCAIWWSLEP
mgnify:CR=1 FL=1